MPKTSITRVLPSQLSHRSSAGSSNNSFARETNEVRQSRNQNSFLSSGLSRVLLRSILIFFAACGERVKHFTSASRSSPGTAFPFNTQEASIPLTMRVVRALDPITAQSFCDNTIVNSRYTIWNFLFKNLYEQFSRPLNAYFLVVSCLQFISIIAPVNPLSTLLPLLFAFSLTAVKEGYDDLKRHRQDAKYNARICQVLRKCGSTGFQWTAIRSADIRVGDALLLSQNDEIPCDVVPVVIPSESKDVVYIRTENLDGEIDLKARDAVTFLDPTHGAASSIVVPTMQDTLEVIEDYVRHISLLCPPPSAAVDSFEARAEYTRHEDHHHQLQHSLTNLHLLPQSSFLKNTSQIVAVAVYTGNETKCGMNKHDAPVKWAKIDQQVSSYAKAIFVFQILSALTLGISGYAVNQRIPTMHWYLCPSEWELQHVVLNFLVYPARFFLLTTVMVPISFKFLVDLSKYFMALVLEWDLSMYDEERGEGMKVQNSSIVEDLGQTEYLLTDKTGTLTENSMDFRGFSYQGKFVRLFPAKSGGETSPNFSVEVSKDSMTKGGAPFSDLCFASKLFESISLCNSVEVCIDPGPTLDGQAVRVGSKSRSVRYAGVSPDEESLCRGVSEFGVRLINRTKERAVLEFDPKNAASLDGVQQYSQLSQSSVQEEYMIHHVFPFSSAEKMMGVIVSARLRTPSTSAVSREGDASSNSGEKIRLIVKGADDKILSLLATGSSDTEEQERQRSIAVLSDHVRRFSLTGLRTLVVAEKELTDDELHKFKWQWGEAMLDIKSREEKLKTLRDTFIRQLCLVGATAIEDQLQSGVPETIRDFTTANIRVWMLTGDKLETAQQVGIAAGLILADDNIVKISGENWERELQAPNLDQMRQARKKQCEEAFSMLVMSGIDHSSAHGTPRSNDSADGLLPSSKSLTSAPRVSPATDSKKLLEDSSGDTNRGGSNGDGGVDVHPSPHIAVSVLIVEGGTTLDSILRSEAKRLRLLNLLLVVKSAIFARVTPLQKAAVASLIRRIGKLTVAVGDGGNDVAMLQEAHVGIGIIGKEGQQAARASDFAITRFRFLRPLLFVHGHFSYRRTCFIVQYSFYKSMLISFIQLAFNMTLTLWSGVSFWNSFALTMWNGFYTLPQTLFYCLDRPCPRSVVECSPALYRLSQRGYTMNVRSFAGCIARGIAQSVVLLLVVSSIFDKHFSNTSLDPLGDPSGQDTSWTVAYSSLILVQLFTVLLESRSVTLANAIIVFGMPLIYWIFSTIYNSFSQFAYYRVFEHTETNVYFLSTLAITACLFLPHFLVQACSLIFYPNALEQLRVQEIARLQRMESVHKSRRPMHLHWPSEGSTTSKLCVIIQVIGRMIASQLNSIVTSEEKQDAQDPAAML